ncbi:hypothetical protein NLI96_g7076 [Meripilus lineatus]|uniref:Uncharacterized protein n=1 Tax=Meripilus lineatus TaxID=2056292 RepID=A0AAD5YHJ4_9APHY|nr:hypothetical protein NLI96_g7076 [Physisporinus lineatus]
MVSRLYAVSQECKVGTIIIPFTPAFYFSLLSLLTHSILMAKRKGKSAQPSCRSKRARRASHSPPPAISQSGNSDFSGPLTPTDSRSISPHSPTHSVLPNVEAPFPPLATAAASSSQHGITADDRHSGATPAPALPPSTPSSRRRMRTLPSHLPMLQGHQRVNLSSECTWTQYHAGHGGRSYIDSTLAKRMNTCRLKNAPDSATFSLDNLDFPLAFGPKQHGPDDCSKYVCLNKNPIKIWILGEIQAVVFKKEHLNARRAAVLINTFREEDRLRIKEIFTKFSQPPRGTTHVLLSELDCSLNTPSSSFVQNPTRTRFGLENGWPLARAHVTKFQLSKLSSTYVPGFTANQNFLRIY